MPDAQAAWWSRDAAGLSRGLGSGPGGLSSDEAAARLRQFGGNVAADQGGVPAARVLLRQVQSPLVLILVFGALVSLVVREWIDASIVLAIVLVSVVLGFLQEYRASAAVAELRQRLALLVRVVRDGSAVTVPATTVVPGDVVELAAGNLIPGDGVVLAARDFLVIESSLTGESFPVEKQPGAVPAATPLAGRGNAVHLGTSVRSGTATVLIVNTGRNTVLGAIAGRLAASEPESEFARGVRQFGYLLVRVMLVMVVFVLVVNQLLDRPALESLLFAMALAVGMSPELLPAIVSVTLSRGAREMAKRGVIVARLEALENLGSIDVLCTDKTGTLTLGVVGLNGAVDPEGNDAPSVLELAWLNASLETGIENPLDAAIVEAGTRAGLAPGGHAKVDEIPYDFMRKRLTIVVAPATEPASHLIVTKGAFDDVLAICRMVSRGDLEVPLDAATRERLGAFYRQKGAEGFRVLAVASRRVTPQARYAREDEAEMTFRGFLLFQDPPKETSARTIGDLAALGIRVKVVTGDNRFVAAHLAGSIGLDTRTMITGAEIASLRDEALWQKAEQADLFVEVDPQQKERIVRALQSRGHAVGYLGDGINDAPALRAADVGISVDGAVDVARESADVVLLEPDLDVLRQGIEDGRRTFANTLKYISITTSANFGNMVSMAIATPLLPFLPLAAKQILLNNFLSDIPSVFISTDNVDPESLKRAQRWRVAEVQRFMIVFGLLSTVFDLATFALLLQVFGADQAVFQTTWFVVSLLTELAVLLVLRSRGPAVRSRPSAVLLWSTVAVAGLAVAFPWLGPVAAAFSFVPLPLSIGAAVIGIVAAYVLSTELVKAWFFRSR
ncbi:MAG: magnesium-translocating P-type ATPase [Chromatiales bacterium]|nr:magnesium-translocating P-type ATPase [Chromatiales bacterium]